jgi:hypothetical protein
MKPADNRISKIEREQQAFDDQLTTMLRDHAGEFVLFNDGQPVSFFKSYEDAYAAGLAQFGVDQPFLVSEVKRRVAQSTSLAWEAGVMFVR